MPVQQLLISAALYHHKFWIVFMEDSILHDINKCEEDMGVPIIQSNAQLSYHQVEKSRQQPSRGDNLQHFHRHHQLLRRLQSDMEPCLFIQTVCCDQQASSRGFQYTPAKQRMETEERRANKRAKQKSEIHSATGIILSKRAKQRESSHSPSSSRKGQAATSHHSALSPEQSHKQPCVGHPPTFSTTSI